MFLNVFSLFYSFFTAFLRILFLPGRFLTFLLLFLKTETGLHLVKTFSIYPAGRRHGNKSLVVDALYHSYHLMQLVLADNHKQHPALGLRIPPYGLECSHSPVHFPGNVIGNLFVL